MSARLKLEVFDGTGSDEGQGRTESFPTDPETEDARLEAFEAGYKAGWDDAASAQQAEEGEYREAIKRNLQDLSFTYHEARSHVLRALAPLFSEITARLLPEIARASLPHVVAEALGPYADLVADAPIKVQIHPDARDLVEGLLGRNPGVPLQLMDDIALTPGKVQLSLGTTETRIDLDAALVAIRTAIDDFFELTEREKQNG
jgi:flagellar assembly protein FliH